MESESEDSDNLTDPDSVFDQIQEGGSNTFYRTTHVNTIKNDLFEIKKKEINLELTNQQMDFFKANKSVDELFKFIYDTYIKNCSNSLKVQIVIFLPGFFQTPVSSKFLPKLQMSSAFMLGLVDNVIQSKKPSDFESIATTNKMKIVISFAKMIQGGGKRKRGEEDSVKKSIINLEDYCNANRFITVLKKDRLCLVKAIVIAKAHLDKEKNAFNLKNNRLKLKDRVGMIVNTLNLPQDVDLNLTHVKKIDEYLEDYSIVVYSGGARRQTPVYFNKENIQNKFIYILHRDEHFDALLNIKSFFKTKYWCHVSHAPLFFMYFFSF
jgi:hypothetical protein